MELNPYESPKAVRQNSEVGCQVRRRVRMVWIAVILVSVLAYLTVVVLYLVEEVRYNAAEMERVRQRYQTASPLP